MSRPIYITNMNLSCGSDLKWSPEQLSVVVHKYGAHKFCSLAWLQKYFDCIFDCVVGVILVCVVVQFYPWFLLYFPLIQTHYHTLQYPKTKEIKFEPRIKFNHNICKLLSNRKRGNEEIQFLCDLGVLHLIGKVHRGSNTDLVLRRFFPFSQGETFDCPERVPFRLTHNIVNAMVSDSRKNDILKKRYEQANEIWQVRSRFSDFEDSRSAFNWDLFFIFIFFSFGRVLLDTREFFVALAKLPCVFWEISAILCSREFENFL